MPIAHSLTLVIVESDPLLLRALGKALQHIDSSLQITAIPAQQLHQHKFINSHFDIAFVGVGIENEQQAHQWLTLLQQQCPLTIRCLLKGATTSSWDWQLNDNIHFCLAKPYSHADLRHVINCTAKIQSLAIDTATKSVLGKMNGLPVMRQQIAAIMSAFTANPVEIPVIADLISNDPFLSGKVIQTANSAFLGFSSETVNLQQALARIGTSACHALVVHTEAHSHYQHTLSEQQLAAISTNAFARAKQARELAKQLNLSTRQKDTVFILGLLSGVGAMALAVLAKTSSEQATLNEELVAAYILNLWGFSSTITENMLLPEKLSQVTSIEMAVHYLAKKSPCEALTEFEDSEYELLQQLKENDELLECPKK